MGGALEMEYKFAEVHGRESILIPGTSIIKEYLEKQGVLMEYMTKNHKWIARQFAKTLVFSNRILLIFIAFSGTVSNRISSSLLLVL